MSEIQSVKIFEPSNAESAEQYRMKTAGNHAIREIETDLGQNHPTFRCAELYGEDSSLHFVLPDMSAQSELILEIQEVHSRYDKPFSYWISVAGKQVYYRTYAPCCDGLNHYFVRVPGNLSHRDLTVSIRIEEDNPVRFYRIYAYADALELAKSESVNAPMFLGLFSPGLSGDEAEDKRRLIDCRETYAPYPVICGYDVFYMRMSREGLHQRLDYLLRLSSATGVPISIDLNSWWSGTPTGMDGLGGNFRDLAYQQVVYDPANATGFGIYQLTTPNYWKSLPWMSLCNAHYNAAREERLREATHYLKERIAFYRAGEAALPDVAIFTENEPDYWHYGAWHNSYQSISGVEPAAVKAAAKDGVALCPEKMDDRQRAWLWKKLNDYICGVGGAIAEGIGNGISIVKDGCVTVPDDILTEHCYTHATTGRSNQPYGDESHAIWETHLIDSIRFGYQGGVGRDDPRPLEYASCYGRLAGVNKEQLRENAYDILPYSYLFGADFQTIFNYNHCTESLKNAPKPLDYRDEPVPTFSYNKQLLRYDFNDDNSLVTDETLISADNMVFCNARGSRAVRADDAAKSGNLVFRIHSDSGFPDGMVTELRATVNRNTADIIELGYSPDCFCFREEISGRNQYVGSYYTDWSDRIDRTACDLFLKIIMPSGLHATEYNAPERNSICCAAVRIPRVHRSGPQEKPFTFEELRTLNRLAERREDARRLLKHLPHNKKLEEQFAAGLYQTVYRALLVAQSQSLPCEFFVCNRGPLSNFGLYAETDVPVYITLLSADAAGYRLRITAENKKTASVRLSVAEGGIALLREKDCCLLKRTQKSGRTVSIAVSPAKTELPVSLSVRILKINENDIQIQSQNTELTFYADSVSLSLSGQCRFFIAEDGSPEETETTATALPAGISAHLETDCKAVIAVHAVSGSICGIVTAFSEAAITGEIRYPSLTVSDGIRSVTAKIGSEFTFDFSTASGTALHTSKIGHLGLSCGQKIVLEYYTAIDGCPENRAKKISDAAL